MTKTKEMIGKPLDWAVSIIEMRRRIAANEYVKAWAQANIIAGVQCDPYSVDWLWAGEIIEREQISVLHRGFGPDNTWFACYGDAGDEETLGYFGPTPLVAAMRAYVAHTLGDEIDIPDSLENTQ